MNGLDQVCRAGQVADTPAGHGIALGSAVDYDGAVSQFGADVQERPVGPGAPVNMFINVVAGDKYFRVFKQDVAQGPVFLLAVDLAGWVGRGIKDHHAGVFIQRVL